MTILELAISAPREQRRLSRGAVTETAETRYHIVTTRGEAGESTGRATWRGASERRKGEVLHDCDEIRHDRQWRG